MFLGQNFLWFIAPGETKSPAGRQGNGLRVSHHIHLLSARVWCTPILAVVLARSMLLTVARQRRTPAHAVTGFAFKPAHPEAGHQNGTEENCTRGGYPRQENWDISYMARWEIRIRAPIKIKMVPPSASMDFPKRRLRRSPASIPTAENPSEVNPISTLDSVILAFTKASPSPTLAASMLVATESITKERPRVGSSHPVAGIDFSGSSAVMSILPPTHSSNPNASQWSKLAITSASVAPASQPSMVMPAWNKPK